MFGFFNGFDLGQGRQRMVIGQLEFRGNFASIISHEKQKKHIENLLCKWNVLLSGYFKTTLFRSIFFASLFINLQIIAYTV